jgi:hypothetical protein
MSLARDRRLPGGYARVRGRWMRCPNGNGPKQRAQTERADDAQDHSVIRTGDEDNQPGDLSVRWVHESMGLGLVRLR